MSKPRPDADDGPNPAPAPLLRIANTLQQIVSNEILDGELKDQLEDIISFAIQSEENERSKERSSQADKRGEAEAEASRLRNIIRSELTPVHTALAKQLNGIRDTFNGPSKRAPLSALSPALGTLDDATTSYQGGFFPSQDHEWPWLASDAAPSNSDEILEEAEDIRCIKRTVLAIWDKIDDKKDERRTLRGGDWFTGGRRPAERSGAPHFASPSWPAAPSCQCPTEAFPTSNGWLIR